MDQVPALECSSYSQWDSTGEIWFAVCQWAPSTDTVSIKGWTQHLLSLLSAGTPSWTCEGPVSLTSYVHHSLSDFRYTLVHFCVFIALFSWSHHHLCLLQSFCSLFQHRFWALRVGLYEDILFKAECPSLPLSEHCLVMSLWSILVHTKKKLLCCELGEALSYGFSSVRSHFIALFL